MIIEIVAKLLAESLLSLYPTFVKNIGLPLGLQLWSRCFSYVAISSLFIDWSFIYNHLFSKNGLLLSTITAAHIYTSYRGFQLLEGGIAYAIFYTYPLMILLLSGEKIHYSIAFAILGVILIYMTDDNKSTSNNKTTSDNKSTHPHDSKTFNLFGSNEGYFMIFLAAFTEALIYFLVREIKTTNNWNHLFLSYLLGAIATSGYYSQDIVKLMTTTSTNTLTMSLIINSIIGLFGYVLRFFAISRLSPVIYAPLSYFGIIMAVIYGYIFNGEIISPVKIIGIIFIVIGLLF